MEDPHKGDGEGTERSPAQRGKGVSPISKEGSLIVKERVKRTTNGNGNLRNGKTVLGGKKENLASRGR